MIFDSITHKVEPESMTRDEALVFLAFLHSEILRHDDDIKATRLLMTKICRQFDIATPEDFNGELP